MAHKNAFKVVLASVMVLTSVFFASSSVFAAPHSSSPYVPPPHALPPQQCLVVAFQIQNITSQTFTVVAHTTNSCGFTFDVTTRINNAITDCLPFPSSSNPFTVTLRDRQTAAISVNVQGGCVVCTNHVPTAFPPFTVRVTAFAFGTVHTRGGNFQASSNNAGPANVRLSNNPHPFVPPCP